jgi:hypothetical protein
MPQVVEGLLCKYKALSSNSNIYDFKPAWAT